MRKIFLIVLGLCCVLALTDTRPVSAATLFVDPNGVDTGNCQSASQPCGTIRYALRVAVDGDVINIAGGPYIESVTVDKSVTLAGNPTCTPCSVWYGDGGDRIMEITGEVSVVVRDLNLIDGQDVNGGAVLVDISTEAVLQNVNINKSTATRGGGIYNLGVLVLDDVFISNNQASERGGGLYNMGELTMDNVRFLDNEAELTGGGLYSAGPVTANNLYIYGNTANGGGGIYNLNELFVEGSVFTRNRARGGSGGALSNQGSARVVDSEVSSNVAFAGCEYPVGSPPMCDPDPAGGGVYNAEESSLVLTFVDLLKNEVHAEDEREGRGGGVANDGEIIIAFTTVEGNRVDTNDYMSPYGDGRAFGGGFYNRGSGEIFNSTFSYNSAEDDTFSLAHGGGIFNEGELFAENSTISDNEAADLGGGIHNTGFFEMVHLTVSYNQAGDPEEPQEGVGQGIFNANEVRALHTIIALNGGEDCFNQDTLIIAGPNLDSDGTCTDFSIQGVDPLLGPLKPNGGPTHTRMLLSNSPAINVGDFELCKLNDQRGFPRPIGVTCDLGAIERGRSD